MAPRGLLRRRQEVRDAIRKARKLMGMVQGTMGLEGAALDRKTLRAMTKEATYELLGIRK